jgi:hypothetical protein
MSSPAPNRVVITEAMYFMGRDGSYAAELTPAMRASAYSLLVRVNALLHRMAEGGLTPENSPRTGSPVTSGWRPARVNERTPGAAPRSHHLRCNAIDLYDPEGALDDWCMDNQDRLAALGLYLEHPSATKGWCHLQSVPPRSGKRVFYP